jgi:hypothetical protein
LVLGSFVLVPYFRGKSDLLPGWNSLLLEIIKFTGLSAIEVNCVPKLAWQHLDWFQPTTANSCRARRLATSAGLFQVVNELGRVAGAV